MNDNRPRCEWVGSWESVNPLALAYHDEEWGVPSRDDAHLFEMLTLEGAQSGLSWMTILRKREGYRRAFAGFDAEKVARFRGRHREAARGRVDRAQPGQDRVDSGEREGDPGGPHRVP